MSSASSGSSSAGCEARQLKTKNDKEKKVHEELLQAGRSMQEDEIRLMHTTLCMHQLQLQPDSLARVTLLAGVEWARLDVQLVSSSGAKLHEALLTALRELKPPSSSTKAAELKHRMASVQELLLAKLLEYDAAAVASADTARKADSLPPFHVWRFPLAQWREANREREYSPEFMLNGLRWRLLVLVDGNPNFHIPGCMAAFLELRDPRSTYSVPCHFKLAMIHPLRPCELTWRQYTHAFSNHDIDRGFTDMLLPGRLEEYTHADGCVALKGAVAPKNNCRLMEWTKPRDANHLLLHFAMGLSSADLSLLWPFITRIIEKLHARGFDLNQRDAEGRTLLTQYAAQCDKVSGLELVHLLLRLGACASVESASGATLLCEWVRLGLHKLVLAVLKGSAPWQMLLPQLEVWQRPVAGMSTLSRMVEGKGDSWSDIAACVCELAHHWRTQKRPLLLRYLSEIAPLFPDLALLVLSYIDGQERPSDRQ